MNVYIDRDELVRGLTKAQEIVERCLYHPVLAHVLLRARSPETLQMTATNITLTLVTDHAVRVEGEGELSVDATSFYQIAKSLRDPVVQLHTADDHRLHVTCGRAKLNIVGSPAEEFPALPALSEGAAITLTKSSLRRIIEETMFSINTSKRPWRDNMKGALLECIGGEGGPQKLRVCTSDGYRLAWSEAPCSGSFGEVREMLLPREAIAELKKLSGKRDDATWSIAFGKHAAIFTTTRLTFITRLIDDKFPDYRLVLPTSWKRRATLPRIPFTDALGRISAVANDRNHSARFAFGSDGLVLTAANANLGDVREEVPCQLDGEEMTTGFNVHYFQGILVATSSDHLRLCLGDPLDPCVVRLPDRDDCLFVVMPFRFDDCL